MTFSATSTVEFVDGWEADPRYLSMVLAKWRGGVPVSRASEVVLGEVLAAARLSIGIEQLRLIVTNTRIIVAHLGKRGIGVESASAFFGALSAGLEDLLKSGRESLSKARSRGYTPDQILALDKDNFAIRHDEIISVTLAQRPHTVAIMILTSDQKLEFATVEKFERLVRLLEGPMGTKLVAR